MGKPLSEAKGEREIAPDSGRAVQGLCDDRGGAGGTVMNGSIVQPLVKHGYSVLFASMLARQMCLPVPAILVLIGAWAVAGSGRTTSASASYSLPTHAVCPTSCLVELVIDNCATDRSLRPSLNTVRKETWLGHRTRMHEQFFKDQQTTNESQKGGRNTTSSEDMVQTQALTVRLRSSHRSPYVELRIA